MAERVEGFGPAGGAQDAPRLSSPPGAQGAPFHAQASTSTITAPPSPLQPPDPLIGRVLDGRYRVLSLIAEGGMGRVYKAEQTSLGRVVAIKTLGLTAAQVRQDPQFQQRFALEAAATSRLSNPHTVTIFDYGHTQDGIYYIVMEYVEGRTLSQVMRLEGRMAPARAVTLIRQLSIALREAHRRGIIHRDIKPANLLLVQDGYELVKVLDFGIAKMMHKEFDSQDEVLHEITRSGTFLGTPEYMAPEAMAGKADHRSDLYSLGVVLYLMLTGRLPFKSSSPADTILMVMQDPVPPIDPALGVPADLEAAVMHLLEKHPNDRFESVDAFWAALNPISQSLGIEVPLAPPTLAAVGELEPDLLTPYTRAEHLAALLGTDALKSRRQLGVMAFTAAVVVAVGGLLLFSGSPAPEPEAVRGVKQDAMMVAPPAQGAVKADLKPPTPAVQGNVGAPPPSQASGAVSDAAAKGPDSAGLAPQKEDAAKKAGKPATKVRRAPQVNASPPGTSPDSAQDEEIPDGYKPSPY